MKPAPIGEGRLQECGYPPRSPGGEFDFLSQVCRHCNDKRAAVEQLIDVGPLC